MSSLRREITERKKSECEAREALSVRSSFIGVMSHEVRTPLNSILGLLHLIESSEDVPERQRHYANVATKAALQLLHQLSNVIDMSRLDSNAVTITVRPTDIRRLAEQWRETAAAAVHFHQKDIQVTLEIAGDLDREYCLDGARLTQIVTNLTDNAAKFTEQGEIHIGLCVLPEPNGNSDTTTLQISIADTGPGIGKPFVDRMFNRFTQADDGINRSHGGSGLGLAISHEMAGLMGANLAFSGSERDGFSTEFLIHVKCNVRLDA
jgi:signal transduction histidine kinase